MMDNPVFIDRLKEILAMPYQSLPQALPSLAAALIAASLIITSTSSAQQAGGTPRSGVKKSDSKQIRRTLRSSTYGVRKSPARNVNRNEIISELGGSAETEAAVVKALDWFHKTQKPDGSWSESQSNVAHTGLVILCYLSYGVKPSDETEYGQDLDRGLDWLVKQVNEKGVVGKGRNFYVHAIGTLALGEAAGITRLQKYYQPLERAVAYICFAQHPKSGGWKYKPLPSLHHTGNPEFGDLSVSGFAIMALRSAEMAGLQVPTENLNLAQKFLDSRSSGRHKGVYSYKDFGRGSIPRESMVVVGMYCQQLFGIKPDDERQIESVEWIAANNAMPAPDQKVKHCGPYYYWYYGCLSMFLHGGKPWQEWNDKMKPIFLDKQQDDGTWKPEGTHSRQEGTTITTAYATLSLTVYYRYLPIYNGYARRSGVITKRGGSTFGLRKQRPATQRSNTTKNR